MYFANEPDSPADHLDQLDDSDEQNDQNDQNDRNSRTNNDSKQHSEQCSDSSQQNALQPADVNTSETSVDIAADMEHIPSMSDDKKAGKDLTCLDSLGKNIRRVRKSKQLTLQQAAKQCNIRWQQLQVVESGKTNFSIQLLFCIIRGLGINDITEIWPTDQIFATSNSQATATSIEQKPSLLDAIQHEGERKAVERVLSASLPIENPSIENPPIENLSIENPSTDNMVKIRDESEATNRPTNRETIENLLEVITIEPRSKDEQKRVKMKTYVAKMRIERDWTQQKLATESGMSLSTIRHIEHSRKNPRMDSLQKIANAFGVDVRELLPATSSAERKV